jgi:hypothetical protein
MEMKRRLLYVPVFHIDANLINARQKLSAVNQLEKWFSDGVILINMSGTARTEAKAGNDGQRDRKADRQIYTMTPALESGDPIYRLFEDALFPNGALWTGIQNRVIPGIGAV